jgi:hypothetical protein
MQPQKTLVEISGAVSTAKLREIISISGGTVVLDIMDFGELDGFVVRFYNSNCRKLITKWFECSGYNTFKITRKVAIIWLEN